jgi:D-alanine-D-alanine ligase
MEKKVRVAIVFGGKSAEHEIALLSTKNILNQIDRKKYEVTLIGIDKLGQWHVRDEAKSLLHASDPKRIQLNQEGESVALVTKETGHALVSLDSESDPRAFDVVFPVLHGTNGEDGTVQGLLKLANIPFVGASVLGSAVGMDKDAMKRLLRDSGIPIADFITATKWAAYPTFEQVTKKLGLPFFIKPANLGSSVGVHKVKSEAEYLPALNDAFRYDNKVLIEEFVDGKEIECAIIGNDKPIASVPGEIDLCGHEFHSYEAKYYENGIFLKVPAPVSPEVTKNIQQICIDAYLALYCEGMARVDLFLTKDNRVIINEINTIPGFTPTSACPKLWAASGIPMPELIDRLIGYALERHARETALKTDFF